MRIWIQGDPSDRILMIAVDFHSEAELLKDFTRVDEPLVAVLKHNPDYQFSHLEIRKEKT